MLARAKDGVLKQFGRHAGTRRALFACLDNPHANGRNTSSQPCGRDDGWDRVVCDLGPNGSPIWAISHGHDLGPSGPQKKPEHGYGVGGMDLGLSPTKENDRDRK